MLFYIKNGISEACSHKLRDKASANKEKTFEFSGVDRFISAKKRRKNALSIPDNIIYKEGNYVYYRNFK